MNYKQFNIALPIKDNNTVIISGLVQYDTANIVNVRLMDGTEPFDFTGYTEVFIEILKPDGTHIQSCVTDDPEITGDNNPYSIQIVDPMEGRISFTLRGQATLLTGTHFCQIMIAAGGKLMTSARINYYVDETLQDIDADFSSSSEYTTLLNLINRNSAIATAERTREDSEMQRILADKQRDENVLALTRMVQEYIDNANGYVDDTKANMELAQQYAELAQNPSAEIMESLIEQLNLVSKLYVDNLVATNTKNFDAGLFTDSAESKKLLKVRTGLAEDIPELADGEFGLATDTKRLYIGDIPVNGVYVASETAPSETHVLWIDISTAGKGSIKYYDGSSWQPTATASFS